MLFMVLVVMLVLVLVLVVLVLVFVGGVARGDRDKLAFYGET